MSNSTNWLLDKMCFINRIGEYARGSYTTGYKGYFL